MAKPPKPPPHADLELLDTYLMSEAAPASSMGLSDLDGFLTALAIGPAPVKPSEWLPLVWGNEEPDFDTVKQADAVLGAIMARYTEIGHRVATDPDKLDPVFLEGDDADIVVTDWAAGFMDAVILHAKAWEPILENDEGRALMLPIMVLGSEEDRPLFDTAPLPEDEMQALLAEGADIIIEAVPAIYDFWRERES